MNAYEIPNLRFSLPAGGEVARHRFVAVNTDGHGIQANATAHIVGASMNQTKAGEVLEVADGIVMVEAAGAVEAGKAAYADANGKVTGTGTVVAGVVITSATEGGLAAVKIN